MRRLAQAAAVAWIVLGIAGNNLEAQDEARQVGADSTVAELWQNMHEAGMISDEEYKHALRYGALPGPLDARESVQTVAEAEAAAEERAALMAERRVALAPFMVNAIADQNGEARTLADMRAAKRERLAERLALKKRQLPGEKARLQQLKLEKGWPDTTRLDSGSDAVLVGEKNGRPLYYVPHNTNAADTISTDELWPGGATGLDLDGAGTIIGLWDQYGVRHTHVEFTSRVTQQDGPWPFNFHATGTAGTLISAGVNPFARGMSFAANLHAYDFADDLIEMPDAALAGELHISNHSYGLICGWHSTQLYGWLWYGETTISAEEDYKFGFYLGEWSDTLDQIVYDAGTYLPVFSSGNDQGQGPESQPVDHWAKVNDEWKFFSEESGVIRQIDGGATGFDTVNPLGVAKNVVTVGAVHGISGGYSGVGSVVLAYFSSMGPTDGGRIKPDLVAKGYDLVTTGANHDAHYQQVWGTSFSAPSVAGSLNLLRQLYHSAYSEDYPMLASTLKAVAIHTADEAGNVGPDYSFGWGLMNTQTASDLIVADAASDSHPHIKEVFMPCGGTITFPVTTDGTVPLRVTMCWSDPPGIPPGEAIDPPDLMLRNDLDLRVTSPTSVVHQPWVLNPAVPGAPATTGDNYRDNVEQVVVASPMTGDYIVSVTHKGVLVDGAQEVSIIISGNTALDGPAHQITSFVQTAADEFTVIWPTVVGGNYQIESSTDLVVWSDEGGEISPLTTTTAVPLTVIGGTPYKFYRIRRLR